MTDGNVWLLYRKKLETIWLSAKKWLIELFILDKNTWNYLTVCEKNELRLI